MNGMLIRRPTQQVAFRGQPAMASNREEEGRTKP